MKTSYIICGSPGAGKSTYARHLASLKRAMVLDIDAVTEPLVQLALKNSGRSPDDRDSSYFKKTYREPIYETLFSIARENLLVLDVVIVGPFTKELRDSDWPSKLKETLSGPVEVHYVQCPPETCKQRLEKRSNPRDVAKLGDWENYIKYYGGKILPAFDHILVDGANI